MLLESVINMLLSSAKRTILLCFGIISGTSSAKRTILLCFGIISGTSWLGRNIVNQRKIV